MEYAELPEFSRDKKRLSKKYRSLSDDIDALKRTLEKVSISKVGSKHWNCLYRDERICVFKIRLACRYLRATTMRVVYAHQVDIARIVFIELYYKGETENEDRERMQDYLQQQR